MKLKNMCIVFQIEIDVDKDGQLDSPVYLQNNPGMRYSILLQW